MYVCVLNLVMCVQIDMGDSKYSSVHPVYTVYIRVYTAALNLVTLVCTSIVLFRGREVPDPNVTDLKTFVSNENHNFVKLPRYL